MGAGVVTVGRRQYAVGLYWENSPSGRVAQAAREAARHPGQQADFYALRAGTKDGRVPQFGLGQSSAGHKAGMAVFAACLANQQPGSWAGAFRLRDGVVVIVVRDDLIVPDGDQYFENESEARDRLLQEIGFGGLQRVYAPEAWAIPAADSMPISLLLDERRDVKLRLVNIPKRTIIIGSSLVAVLVIILAVSWYIQEKDAEEAAAQAAQQAALERAKLAAQNMLPDAMRNQQPTYPAPERKWEKKPSPLAVVANCQAGLAKVPLVISGWHLSQLKCDGNSISLQWTHEKGIATPPMGAKVSDTGGSANLTIPLSELSERGAENLLDPTEVTKHFLAQDWPGALSKAPDDPLPQPPPGFQGQWNPPPPPWVKRSFTLTVPELPASLPSYFGGLPGVIINILSYSPGGSLGGSWSVEGVIYENRV
jgi:Pilin accessory protein (PilO)